MAKAMKTKMRSTARAGTFVMVNAKMAFRTALAAQKTPARAPIVLILTRLSIGPCDRLARADE